MFRHQLRGMRVVFEHAGKLQVRPAKAEINGRLVFAFDKFRQLVPRAQPRKDAVALPAPGDQLFAREVRRKKPRMFLRVFFNAAMKPVIVPAKRQEYSSLLLSHIKRWAPDLRVPPTHHFHPQLSSLENGA